MEQPNFGRPPTPLITQHLHNDVDVVDGDAAKGSTAWITS